MRTNNQTRAIFNSGCDFRGTMKEHANEAFPLALAAISKATGLPLTSVRLFLDCEFGRTFAAEVLYNLSEGQALAPAIDAITNRWKTNKIDAQTHHTHGLPVGLPYLRSFVQLSQIVDDLLGGDRAT
ncbi:hypothetical protein KN198_01110 [Ralstonia solanacearum]|nr:hypothetical protein KN198_01110 [Ralstonia solanacearum]